MPRSDRPIQGGFSIERDAKNEEGEWVMSPEQINAEMRANLDPPDPPEYDPYDDRYDPYYGDEDD